MHSSRTGCLESDKQQNEATVDAAAIPDGAVKTNNERQQIQSERRDPEKWHDRHVLANVIGDRQQHHRRQRREQKPGEPTIKRGGSGWRDVYPGTLKQWRVHPEPLRAAHRKVQLA